MEGQKTARRYILFGASGHPERVKFLTFLKNAGIQYIWSLQENFLTLKFFQAGNSAGIAPFTRHLLTPKPHSHQVKGKLMLFKVKM